MMTHWRSAGVKHASTQVKFPLPVCTAISSVKARPDMDVGIDASEYQDEPDILHSKVEHLALMIRSSRNLVAYTGAGLSTAAGIGDYASRANTTRGLHWDPARGGGPHMEYLKDSKPTQAHLALAALQRGGFLKEWINQNHDGLAQKATFPQEQLNEVHGSWFDMRNPVVAMNGSLRKDLANRLDHWTQRADMVLALGTSLSGLRSDSIAQECAHRAASNGDGLGLVIVSLTRTPLDDCATLRIFATLEETLLLLASNLELSLPSDAEVRMASRRNSLFRGYAQWYQDFYDGQHPRENKRQIMNRAQPGNPMLQQR